MALFALTIAANDAGGDSLFRALEKLEQLARIIETFVVVRKAVIVLTQSLDSFGIERVVDGRIVSYD